MSSRVIQKQLKYNNEFMNLISFSHVWMAGEKNPCSSFCISKEKEEFLSGLKTRCTQAGIYAELSKYTRLLLTPLLSSPLCSGRSNIKKCDVQHERKSFVTILLVQ